MIGACSYGLLNIKDAYLMSYRFIRCHRLFVINTFFFFDLRFYVPVNSYGHVEKVMLRRSIQLTTLFPVQAWLSG